MKVAIAAALLMIVSAGEVSAQQFVKGYQKSNGTYVSPYLRSRPDGIKENNYSYKAPSSSYGSGYSSSYKSPSVYGNRYGSSRY